LTRNKKNAVRRPQRGRTEGLGGVFWPKRLACAIALLLTAAATPLLAQSAAPITVTPPDLRPQQHDNGFRAELPEAGALLAPEGAEQLSVTLGDVAVEGGFPELAGETSGIVAELKGQRISLQQIYTAASAIEAAHARAGYVLARVSVPPQDLRDGATLRIVVTDGFIESIDVAGLPKRVQGAVRAGSAGLVSRRHVTLRDIEQPLMIASDVPGLTLRSTLIRGTRPGGTRLVLEGSHSALSGSIGFDNQFDPSLGRYSTNAQFSLNSIFGLGEQIYGFAASGYDLTRLFGQDAPARVLGGGLILPLGDGRLSLNPEFTSSRTRPEPAQGSPPSVGRLQRISLRASETLLRTRQVQSSVGLTLERIDESTTLPDFALILSHDRYLVLRFNAAWSRVSGNSNSLGLSMQFSKGLGNAGAISSEQAVASGIPYSRQGSSPDFSRLSAQFRGNWNLSRKLGVSLQAKGQLSFAKPLFRAEQFALEGPDALSAYIGGTTAVDEGLVVRAELATLFALGPSDPAVSVAPYLFAAGGTGRIDAPTALEPGSITSASFGLGLHASLRKLGLSLGVEYAHGTGDSPVLNRKDLVNFTITQRF
jgi:hemolysin activation/secretion protein